MSSHTAAPHGVDARGAAEAAYVEAGEYVNKLGGERLERECLRRIESGSRSLVIDFRRTGQVNSIGVSFLVGVIDAAEQAGARLVFLGVNDHTVKLFELLGLTRHVALAADEEAARARFAEFAPPRASHGH